jgi:glutamyl-tRNA synthetase
MEHTIRKYALNNAYKHEGKANPKSLVGSVIREFPESKKDLKSLMIKINEIVKHVNSMESEEQYLELQKVAPELLEDKKEDTRLKPLDNVSKKGVVMRFAPSPSGPMHIGHAATGGLSALYVKEYGGKFILRIEDTNSDNIYEPAYKMLPSEGKWLFGKDIEVIVQSDRLEIYYDYVERLIKLNSAYICTCSGDDFRKYSLDKQECPCRAIVLSETKKRWKRMFEGFEPGEAVVRFKSNMQHPNPAMRDFPLARINDSSHPKKKQKYRVWPLMNLSVAVDDIEFGMTHIIRAKEHADNAKRQKMIFDVLGKTFPETYFLGRYKFEDLEISASKTKEKIAEGLFCGWDDIRLPTIVSLKRRGYQADAFLNLAKHMGLSSTDKVLSQKDYYHLLDSYNRELIEDKANRLFLVENPVEIKIEKAPKKKVELHVHPDHPKRGKRILNIHEEIFIDEGDLNRMKEGKLHRLIDGFNFIKKGTKFIFDSEDYENFKTSKNKGLIIHYLPKKKNMIAFELFKPDGKVSTGIAEEGVKDLKVGSIIQAERVGYCRLDSNDKNEYVFWFTHK